MQFNVSLLDFDFCLEFGMTNSFCMLYERFLMGTFTNVSEFEKLANKLCFIYSYSMFPLYSSYSLNQGILCPIMANH